MATWKVEPVWKKSVIERNYITKDNNSLVVETGWRWGEFLVYTDDDNPPNIESGVDIYNCGYETELIETWDGCWEDYDYDDCDDETTEWLEEFFEEGNSWLDLECDHEWLQDECEMIIDCDLKITKLNDDNSETDVVIYTGENPNKTDDLTESVSFAEFKCTSCDYKTEDINDLVENPNDDDKGAYLCPKCNSKVDL